MSTRISSSSVTRFVNQRRLYATTVDNAPKKSSKWKLLKNGVKYGLAAGISYGCYGKVYLFFGIICVHHDVIEMYVQRHPPQQADVDPEKKTIVVLGSGWASTSFLKDIDTDYYNVVSHLVIINFFVHMLSGCRISQKLFLIHSIATQLYCRYN